MAEKPTLFLIEHTGTEQARLEALRDDLVQTINRHIQGIPLATVIGALVILQAEIMESAMEGRDDA